MREKVGKSRNTAFFPMICGSGGSKSRLAKAAGAEPAGQMRDEKVHAVVARSTFRSQNVQSTPCSDHFWKHARITCDVTSRGRRKGLCTLSKVSKTCTFCSIFNYNHHYTSLHSNTLHYNYNYTFTTFYYTTLHYTTLHSITLNYITLLYITLH